MITINCILFLFATVYRIGVFVREEYFQVVIDSWKNCQKKTGLEICGWGYMILLAGRPGGGAKGFVI